MRSTIPPLALLAGLCLASPLAAQGAPPARNGGFWIALGLGPSNLDMDCGRCEALPDSLPYGPGGGGQGFLALGGSASSRLLLGAHFGVAFRARGNRDATLLHLAAAAQYYPAATGRFFTRLGVGVNGATLAGGGTLIESSGVSANADVGYDLWRVGRQTLGPYVGVMVGSNGAESASRSGPLAADPPGTPRAVYAGLSIARY